MCVRMVDMAMLTTCCLPDTADDMRHGAGVFTYPTGYLRDLHTSSNHYNWFHHELQVFSRETRGMVWG